ncbi:MAG: AEC family transporter [Eubacteriales bacterium]|nr:AEC family transporter [Eubacteriales bacterium]
MELSSLFETSFVIVALMLVGFLGVRRGVLSKAFSHTASFLIVNVFIVGTIFQSVCSGGEGISPAELPHIILMVTLMNTLCYVLGRLALRLFARGTGAPTELCIGVMNNLLIGLPILQSLYGPTAVLFAGLTSIPFNITLYTYGVWRLSADTRGGALRLKDIFSPSVLATLAALVFFVFSLPVPGAVSRLMSACAGVTMPLSMIVIGVTMGSENLTAALRDRRVYAIALFRLVLAPLATFLLLRLLTDNALLLKSCVVIAGCPTGIVVPILSLQYGHDASLPSNCVIVTTLLSLVTLPILLLLLG